MTESLLKKIKPRVLRGNDPVVVLPLSDWEIIEDALWEISSPRLLKSIAKAREDYRKGKAVRYQSLNVPSFS